jgi:toxin ParE1/3/4
MKVRWSPEAFEDLERIGLRIEKDKPRAAREVLLRIYRGIADLPRFPERGRIGRVEGTRELTLPKLPYIVVYRIDRERVQIIHIHHAAQDWP